MEEKISQMLPLEKLLKLVTTGSVKDEKSEIYFRCGRSEEQQPKTSIRQCAQQLNMSKSTLFRFSRKDHHLKIYKI